MYLQTIKKATRNQNIAKTQTPAGSALGLDWTADLDLRDSQKVM